MKKEMREAIANKLETEGTYSGHTWKAEVVSGLVRVTEYTGDKQKCIVKEMTWDSFTHLFLLNK